MLEMTFLIATFLISLVLAMVTIIPYFYGAPWHPSSRKVIRNALKLCQPRPGEMLYDLGCGDGGVLLIGAREFKLRGIGVEIDPLKTWLARWRIKKAGLADRIRIERSSAFGFDVSPADVIFVYLTHQALDRLLPVLKAQMKPGARLVSYRFCLKSEVPDQVTDDGSTFLYRFIKGTKMNTYS